MLKVDITATHECVDKYITLVDSSADSSADSSVDGNDMKFEVSIWSYDERDHLYIHNVGDIGFVNFQYALEIYGGDG